MPEIKAMTSEQLVQQVPYQDGAGLPSYKKLRQMRRDPTIALIRTLFFSAIWSADWVYEKANDDTPQEWVDYIREQMEPCRRHLLANGALGCFDFGWAPFEKVLSINTKGQVQCQKLKPLLQDITEIVTELDTGRFLGFRNGSVDLPVEKSLLLHFDVEGTDWHGTSTLANAERPYDESLTTYDSARRFDKKMAGAHWIVYYPDESSEFDGQMVPNHEIAAKILKNLQSSGSVAIPTAGSMGDAVDESKGWKIELLDGKGSFPFESRLQYLDTQKIRGLGFLERAVAEGKFGTKAESESHQDFVLTMIEYRHSCILELLNWHLVNQLLTMQFGADAENMVFITNAPLHDDQKNRLATVYDKIISTPEGMMLELDRIDVEALAEQVGVPRQELDDEEQVPLIQPTAPEPADQPPEPEVPSDG